MTQIIESRNFTQIKEIRVDETTNTAIAQGYATTYNSWYDVFGGPDKGGWKEQIDGGACKKSLLEKADVRFLINHDGLPLGRTKSGTLNLLDDEIGLYSESELDLTNPRAQEAFSVMKRGDADQMSFAFRVIREEWNGDYTERIIKELALIDVSLVTYPANPDTVMSLRDEILKNAEKRTAKTAEPTLLTPNLETLQALLADFRN